MCGKTGLYDKDQVLQCPLQVACWPCDWFLTNGMLKNPCKSLLGNVLKANKIATCSFQLLGMRFGCSIPQWFRLKLAQLITGPKQWSSGCWKVGGSQLPFSSELSFLSKRSGTISKISLLDFSGGSHVLRKPGTTVDRSTRSLWTQPPLEGLCVKCLVSTWDPTMTSFSSEKGKRNDSMLVWRASDSA